MALDDHHVVFVRQPAWKAAGKDRDVILAPNLLEFVTRRP
jgi:hypothetical protein